MALGRQAFLNLGAVDDLFESNNPVIAHDVPMRKASGEGLLRCLNDGVKNAPDWAGG